MPFCNLSIGRPSYFNQRTAALFMPQKAQTIISNVKINKKWPFTLQNRHQKTSNT